MLIAGACSCYFLLTRVHNVHEYTYTYYTRVVHKRMYRVELIVRELVTIYVVKCGDEKQ